MRTSYRSNTYIPPLVESTKKLADEYQFKHSCSDEAGRLLSVLAGQVKQGTILEVSITTFVPHRRTAAPTMR